MECFTFGFLHINTSMHHPCWCGQLYLLLHRYIIFLYMNIPQFIHSTTDGYLGYFWFADIMNNMSFYGYSIPLFTEKCNFRVTGYACGSRTFRDAAKDKQCAPLRVLSDFLYSLSLIYCSNPLHFMFLSFPCFTPSHISNRSSDYDTKKVEMCKMN
jgi:hypothetical protein